MEGNLCEWYSIIRRLDIEDFKLCNDDVLSDFSHITIEDEDDNIKIFEENIERLRFKIHYQAKVCNNRYKMYIDIPVYKVLKAERVLTAMNKRFESNSLSKAVHLIEYLHSFDNCFKKV